MNNLKVLCENDNAIIIGEDHRCGFILSNYALCVIKKYL